MLKYIYQNAFKARWTMFCATVSGATVPLFAAVSTNDFWLRGKSLCSCGRRHELIGKHPQLHYDVEVSVTSFGDKGTDSTATWFPCLLWAELSDPQSHMPES